MKYSLEELVNKLNWNDFEYDESGNVTGYDDGRKIFYSTMKDNNEYTLYYLMDNGDKIELNSRGNGVYEHNKLRTFIRDYDIDEYGTIICNYVDGSKAEYNNWKASLYDKNGECYKRYSYDNIKNTETQYRYNGDDTTDIKYARLKHIEYDDDLYYKLMNDLVSIGESSMQEIESACSAADAALASIKPEPFSGNCDGIRSAASEQMNAISSLNEKINYSLLAYDICDKNLKKMFDVKFIDNIFEDNDLAQIFKKSISNYLEDRNDDGILEYKPITNFSSIVNVALNNMNFTDRFMGELAKNVSVDREIYQNLGLTIEEAIDEFKYICMEHGASMAYEVMDAIRKNRPTNFESYNFNPTDNLHDGKYYDFKDGFENISQIQSEMININGFDVEFAQILPKECTYLEKIAFDYTKANVINTLKCLPSAYLSCIENNNNAIVLTSNRDAQYNFRSTWGGYYKPDMDPVNPGLIVIDAQASLSDIDYYVRDTVIHELGHKYDDSLNGTDSKSDLYSRNEGYEKWNAYREKYYNILPGLVKGGYGEEDLIKPSKTSEFYAEAMVAYFLAPSALKTACSEVYYELYKEFPESHQRIDVDLVEYKPITTPTPPPTPQPGPTPAPTFWPGDSED